VFTDSKKYVKSQILAANTLTQIEVLEGQLIDIQVNESKSRLKRGRSISAKDKNTLEEKNKRKASRSL
jgi:hemolysin activation/secretion protein